MQTENSTLRERVDANRIALRRLECKITRHNERLCSSEWYCNHPKYGSDEYDAQLTAYAVATIQRLIGPVDGIYINGDPRGYALKIQAEHADGLVKDWGGYGILAPEKNHI